MCIRDRLEAAAAQLAHLDSVFARARFARELDCVMPEFTKGNLLRLDAARNPVLEATLRPQGRKAVALSLGLGGEETVMVISGPNTGGKTVALKSVAVSYTHLDVYKRQVVWSSTTGLPPASFRQR